MKSNLIFPVFLSALLLFNGCGKKNDKPEPEDKNSIELITGHYIGTDSNCNIRILKDYLGSVKVADTTITIKEVDIIISKLNNEYFEVSPGNHFLPAAVRYTPDTCRLFSNLQGGSAERIIVFSSEKDHILIKDKRISQHSLSLKPEENDIEILQNYRSISGKR